MTALGKTPHLPVQCVPTSRRSLRQMALERALNADGVLEEGDFEHIVVPGGSDPQGITRCTCNVAVMHLIR